MNNINEIIKKLKLLANPKLKKFNQKIGIPEKYSLGVSLPNIRILAKQIGKNHNLALQLWKHNIRETKLLASMIDDICLVTEKQIKSWAKEFDNWEICDQCCSNLFKKHPSVFKLIEQWSTNKKEGTKRASFVLMACLAHKNSKIDNSKIKNFLPIIKKQSTDKRNLVKKGISFALRQIGKRNLILNKLALAIAKEIQTLDSKSAKWIAKDTIKELTNKTVLERLQKQ